jgi:hypothetical protein
MPSGAAPLPGAREPPQLTIADRKGLAIEGAPVRRTSACGTLA